MSGRVPPSSKAGVRRVSRTQLDKAASIFERFTGHDAEFAEKVRIPELPKSAAFIGEVTAICYMTIREGKEEHYKHEFSEFAAPILAVSPDGKQLLLVGGNYRFTDRGIVDNKRGRR